MSNLYRASIVVFVALTAPLVLAQQFPQPGPEHAKLKQLEGIWDGVADFGGEPMRSTATYKMELGGLWLVGDFHSSEGAEPAFAGRSLDSYDPVKKKYVSIFVDSMSTSPLI